MSDQSKAIQNHLTVRVAVSTLTGDSEESKKFLENQKSLKSSIGWNMFFLPIGVIVLGMFQSIFAQQFPTYTLGVGIAGFVSMFFLIRVTKNSIEKSIEQIRYNEVANTTRIIADYINTVGEANGISLASTESNQAGTGGLPAVQTPREEN